MSTGAIAAVVVGAIVIAAVVIAAGTASRRRRLELRRAQAGSIRRVAEASSLAAGRARAEADERAALARRAEAEAEEKLLSAEDASSQAREQHDRARSVDPDTGDTAEEEARDSTAAPEIGSAELRRRLVPAHVECDAPSACRASPHRANSAGRRRLRCAREPVARQAKAVVMDHTRRRDRDARGSWTQHRERRGGQAATFSRWPRSCREELAYRRAPLSGEVRRPSPMSA
jgi:FtsZ-interacting cell division protein ZipA